MAIRPIKVYITGVDRFTKQLGQSMQKLNRMGKQMGQTGRTMTMGLTMPIVGAGFAIARTATSFTASMNKVKALTQAATEPMEEMRNLAKELGRTTKFTATEAADAMAFLGMAGWETNEILAGTPALLDLAASSSTDLARAADIASNIMGAFQIEASGASHVADVLAATTASANVDMEMLAETMKQVGPIARAAGASLEDTAAITGFLGNVGIQGSLAGTSLKNMFARLAAPAGKANTILRAIGVNTVDAAGNLRPYAQIIGELSGKMAKLGTAKQLQVMDVLFGKRAIAGMAAFTADVKKTNSGFAALSKSLQNVDGRAKEMSEIMMEGAPGAFKRFQSALEGMAISIAESGFLEFLEKVANKFADLFRRISQVNPIILKAITVVLGLVAVLGPLIWMVGSLISAFSAIGGAVASAGGVIALISNPIGWIIAAIAALIGILKLAGLKWREIWRLMLYPLTPFVAVVEWVIENWKRLVPFFKLLFLLLAFLFKKFFSIIKPILSPFLWLLDKIIGAIKKILGFGLGIVEKIAGKLLPEELKQKIGFTAGGVEGTGGMTAATGLSAEAITAQIGRGQNINQTNIRIEDKAGVKITTDVEKGDVQTDVLKGLAFQGS